MVLQFGIIGCLGVMVIRYMHESLLEASTERARGKPHKHRDPAVELYGSRHGGRILMLVFYYTMLYYTIVEYALLQYVKL